MRNMNLKKMLSAGLCVAGLIMGTVTTANDDGELLNLARGKSVSYIFLNEDGSTMDPVKAKDPKCKNLIDGKRTDKSIAKSSWGANKAKKLHVRFDFGTEVSPKQIVAIWKFAQHDSHKIDRFKIYTGNDTANLKEVKVHEGIERVRKNGVPIKFDIPAAKGRYLDMVIEQDANPKHKMFTIGEVEIFGPASDRAKLDKK